MFNRHRHVRGLSSGENPIDLEDYGWGFVRSCFDSFEIGWYLDGRLVCLSVVDRGEESMSAVYTFYDPELRGDSLGTFAILRQLELCKAWGLKWLYLGYYVEDCEHMNYKSRFLPHERLDGNVWKRFEIIATDVDND
jgi:arginine-tRNA-protein transferase